MMYWLQIFRLAVLSWVILCAIIELGLGAHSLAAVSTLDLPTFAWTGLGVAVAVLTLLTLPAMLTIDLIRTGAFTSLIVVELSWFGFLGVLFLATGGSAADRAANFWVTCDLWTPAEARNICAETSAAAAFGILAWFFLWAYSTTLLVMLILHASRGHYVWNTSVKEANFGAGRPPKTTTAPAVNAYGAEAKPHENASLNPGQPPYAYPPGAPPASTGYNSPQTTGYNSPQTTGYGQPAGAHPSAYPQV